MTDAAKPRRLSIKAWHVTALQLALSGMHPPDIAKTLNQSRRTVYRFFESEFAKTELTRFHEAVMNAAASERVSPVRKIQSAVPHAIEKLISKLDCGDDKVEFLAACRLLDNAGYVPVKRLSVSSEDAVNQMTPSELRRYVLEGIKPDRLQLPSPDGRAESD